MTTMMNVTINDRFGLPTLCPCGKPASSTWTDTLGSPRYACAEHSPWTITTAALPVNTTIRTICPACGK